MLNKKAKSKNMFKKSISTILASTMLLGSSATLGMLNKTQAAVRNNGVLGYFNDSNITDQTRLMMNGADELNKNNYWMEAKIATDPAHTNKYTAKLYFSIPNYNLNNLIFCVRNRKSTNSGDFSNYSIASGSNYLYLSNLDGAGYEVHVYNGSVKSQNFICKADFECLTTAPTPDQTSDLYNSAGAPYGLPSAPDTPIQLNYAQPTSPSELLYLSLNEEAVPFDASTIKVAFFASAGNRSNSNLNIDHILYDYVSKDSGNINFLVDPQWGIDPSITYEAHFYKNSIKPENFICKATDIKAS